ncbi:MAG TPA: choice-of-anchor tandem repeat GloVer-containing protein [Rhizomicrobium sp.]|jgi:uncharacterized repeat protein (TIGR03803 family)|nr:choice-of-anchor tandem repeat GloVer-containing protein [Rhizomicrobium sp.]
MDSTGALYGTTYKGGANGSDDAGTVFKLSGSTEEVLYSFCISPSCSDGATPVGGVTLDPLGNLYGTTESGGKHTGGTLFEVLP